jgi:hypothetical protein
MSSREFLHLVGELWGVAAGDRARRIEDLAAGFAIDDLLEGLVEEMSRGNRQKIAFVAALLHRPRVLVIDEPSVGLDPEGAQRATSFIVVAPLKDIGDQPEAAARLVLLDAVAAGYFLTAFGLRFAFPSLSLEGRGRGCSSRARYRSSGWSWPRSRSRPGSWRSWWCRSRWATSSRSCGIPASRARSPRCCS